MTWVKEAKMKEGREIARTKNGKIGPVDLPKNKMGEYV